MSKRMLAKFFIGVGAGFVLYYVLKLMGVL